MGSSHFLMKLFLVIIFLALFGYSVSAEKRKCAQCVSGNFLLRRSLMQHSAAGQSMGWVEEWKGTDCEDGNMRIIKCDYSCVTIVLHRHSYDGIRYDGTMKDCADELIHATPDLPQGVDYRFFDGYLNHSNTRSNFTISYEFTPEGFKSVSHVVQEMYNRTLFENNGVKMSVTVVISVLLLFVLMFV